MAKEKELLEFEENPYSNKKGPEEIVRIFYLNNVTVIPVVSKRGILLGVLIKERVISELSDLERSGESKIDDFIMKVIKKVTLDELLPLVGNVKEFTVINLFGEVFGNWSRMELFAACEQIKIKNIEEETKNQKDEQILEWMIYLILEHIPRALYAVNNKGKTVFYNSYFEDIYIKNNGKSVDTVLVEKSISDPARNDFFYKGSDQKEIYFFNKDLKFYYERVPLISEKKNVGYLFYIDMSLKDIAVSISADNTKNFKHSSKRKK